MHARVNLKGEGSRRGEEWRRGRGWEWKGGGVRVVVEGWGTGGEEGGWRR